VAAMMLPSFAPTLAAYLTISPGRRHGSWLPFTFGYLLVWTAAGLLGYGVFALGKDVLAGDLAWQGGGRWLCAGVLIAAATYELIPLKGTCLTRCRGQLEYSPGVSLGGWSGAVAMGARSGGWCIGCSWALMAALFALGVMSLA